MWIFQVYKMCAFSLNKTIKRQNILDISRRSRYTYFFRSFQDVNEDVSIFGDVGITQLFGGEKTNIEVPISSGKNCKSYPRSLVSDFKNNPVAETIFPSPKNEAKRRVAHCGKIIFITL